MDAIEFVNSYIIFLDEIKSVVRPDLYPIVDDLKSYDPHDLITPETWFPSESAARGYVWSLFLKEVAKQKHD